VGHEHDGLAARRHLHRPKRHTFRNQLARQRGRERRTEQPQSHAVGLRPHAPRGGLERRARDLVERRPAPPAHEAHRDLTPPTHPPARPRAARRGARPPFFSRPPPPPGGRRAAAPAPSPPEPPPPAAPPPPPAPGPPSPPPPPRRRGAPRFPAGPATPVRPPP